MFTQKMGPLITAEIRLRRKKLEPGRPALLFWVHLQSNFGKISGTFLIMETIAYFFLSPFVLSLGNEFCERLAYYGMSSNLVTYFKERLGQHNSTAANNTLNWSGTCYITPLIGAFLADSYLGRYRTIAIFSTIYVTVSWTD